MGSMIEIDDRLAELVRLRAEERGLSVGELIRRWIEGTSGGEEAKHDFRLVTVSGEGVFPGIDLDHPRSLLSGEDEDEFRGRVSD